MSEAPKVIVINPLRPSTYGPEVDWNEGDWNVPGYTMEDGTKYHHDDTVKAIEAERDKYRRMDEEAAEHVETVIAMRTGFTGDAPYVGWKGLGLALTEALDDRDALKAKVARYEAALETYADGCDAHVPGDGSCGYEGNMCCKVARKALEEAQ